MRNLPPRMHLKCGSYYYVKANVWTKLSRDYEHALSIYLGIERRSDNDPAAHRAKAYASAYNSAGGNALKRKIEFALTRDDFAAIVARCKGMCEVTGLCFDVRSVGSKRRRPFAPSLDRIDSSGHYTLENCRLICTAVNMLLGEWGEETAATIAKAFLSRRDRFLRTSEKLRTFSNVALVSA